MSARDFATHSLTSARSLLFAPASRPDRLDKAAGSDADIVCADLEDAVGPADKASARLHGLDFLQTADATRPTPAVRALRINGLRTADGLRDVLALQQAGPIAGLICLPKVESAEEVRWADELLAGAPALRLCAFVESPRGLEAAWQIAAASPRLSLLVFGAVDFCAELGTPLGDDALAWARGRLASAAHGAGIGLLDAPCVEFRDLDEVARQARLARGIGFTGKTAIHPSNIATINEAFSPDPATIAQAEGMVAAWEASSGGATTWQGKLIEAPVVARMKRILALRDAIAARRRPSSA